MTWLPTAKRCWRMTTSFVSCRAALSNQRRGTIKVSIAAEKAHGHLTEVAMTSKQPADWKVSNLLVFLSVAVLGILLLYMTGPG